MYIFSLFVFLWYVQLSEDHDLPVGSCPDRGERAEEAKTAWTAGRRRHREEISECFSHQDSLNFISSYQRAIEAQVEERRLQREREEAKRRQEEEEEERRVVLEREMLQRQYEMDTLKEREKVRDRLLYRNIYVNSLHSFISHIFC